MPETLEVMAEEKANQLDSYFSQFEEVQENVLVLEKNLFETNGFHELLERKIISVEDYGDGRVLVKSRVRIRREPLFGNFEQAPAIACLSDLRTHRPENIGRIQPEETDPSKCIFCPHLVYKVTPEPRIIHENLKTPQGNSVVSFPNLYAFTGTHWVTVFADHKPDIRDLTLEDMANYFQSAYGIAKMFRDKGARSMWSIINWGTHAGASQSHPHAQHGTGFSIEGTMKYREREAINYLHGKTGKDPFDEYMSRMRKSDFFIFENDLIFITAPFAPLFPDQVDVIAKSKVMNILETQADRDVMARSMLGVFHMLREKRGVTDLNVVWHQDRFDHGGSVYRLHAHLTPRNKNKYAGLEIYGAYVNSVDPEKTASEGRKWYNNGK